MIPLNLRAWAIRHHVSDAALYELQMGILAELPAPPPPDPRAKSEAYTQSQVRLEGAAKGVRLWRNNVGALRDEGGRVVRYGLANDSANLNERLKSADLVGWRSVIIEPRHVGTIIARFTSRECKPPGWKFTGTDREEAQSRWGQLVNSEGGDAAFTTGPGTL